MRCNNQIRLILICNSDPLDLVADSVCGTVDALRLSVRVKLDSD